jgi:pre-mRNA-splicing helicase BRR2
MFQIALKKNLGQLSLRILEFCKMVEKRMWSMQSPLRQYMDLPDKLFRRIEQQEQLTWDHFCSMTPEQLSVVIKNENLSRKIHQFLKLFPKLETNVYAQPVTRGQVKVQVDIQQQFQWKHELHGGSMFFWIFVLDVDEENLIFAEQICLKPKNKHMSLDFMLPLLEPLQPHYFIKVVSDSWLNCETSIPLLFTSLTLPRKFPLPSDIQSESVMSLVSLLQPKTKTKGHLEPSEQTARVYAAEFLFKNRILVLNVLQSNLFEQFWMSFESLFVGANSNSGKFVMSLMSVIKLAVNDPERQSRVLLLFPDPTVLTQKLGLVSCLAQVLNCSFYSLTGNVAKDVKNFKKQGNFLILSTSQNFDKFTRNPSKRASQLQRIKQVIICQIEALNLGIGGVYETTLIRLRYLFYQMELKVRFIALASSVANYTDLTDFLGIEPSMTFNAHPSILNNFINLLFYSFSTVDPTPRFVSMARQFYRMLKINSFKSKLSVAYVDSLRSAKILLSNLIKHFAKDKVSIQSGSSQVDLVKSQISDVYLQFFLDNGCAYVHDHQSPALRQSLLNLFKSGDIRVLVVSKGLFREISFGHKVDISVTFDSDFMTLMDHLTILGKNNRILYTKEAWSTLIEDVDFSQSLVSQVGNIPFSDELCNSLLAGDSVKSIILSKSSRKDFLKRSLFEPIPIESRLLENLTEALNSEIVSKVVGTKQESLDWLTWSFLYRRVTANPNYYGLSSRSSDDVSEFLSEVIENNIDDLQENHCVAVEEDVSLEADNLGVIASYYGIRIQSMGTFANAVQEGVSWEALFKTFACLPEMGNEDVTCLCAMNQQLIQKMYQETRFKFFNPNDPDAHIRYFPDFVSPLISSFSSPKIANNILFQLLLNRSDIPGEFRPHLEFLLEKTFNLIQGFIDSANVFQKLKPALLSMKFNQMLVQSTWFDDSNLLQLPHVNASILETWKQSQVQNLDDFFELEDEDRESILKSFSPTQIEDIAEAANRYPSITLEASVEEGRRVVQTDEPFKVHVQIERDNLEEEDTQVGPVQTSNGFLKPKQEYWWVVIGDKGRNLLLSVKKVQFLHGLKKDFSVELSEEGDYNLSVFLICDSYLGCDNEIQDLKLKVISQPQTIQEE